MRVRDATPGDLPAVMNVLDGAMLAVDAGAVRESIEREDGAVLVAVAGSGNDERVVGALVLDGRELAAVAVRPARRGQGVGTALVEAAAARRDRLVAEFDADVRPFYESLGFTIEPTDEGGRYRGAR